MLTCNLLGAVVQHKASESRISHGTDTEQYEYGNKRGRAPRSSFISDPNGKIENIVSKCVAWVSGKIKLRCESTPILDERIKRIA